ncbi:alpha-hydroxy-acid oxidizing protein [Oceanobacillus jeddahense]|uniref:L-lactate oxidase n=1 Tax=Oceanobacillus jeddahense TaxID=1462527 RepID=A0ABY5JWY4_9BACI|nr:alpha-hydroxy-acid oxidizing protein [Oceanobacillus jeddahense]UUI03942.1 alpha-hydroxy-acid oxidizing protein [Oceanobacillus jeddahense]
MSPSKEGSFLEHITIQDSFPIGAAQLEAAAKQALPEEIFGHIRSGAGGEETLRKNRAAFEKYSIIPRFLRNVSEVDTSIRILGKEYASPLMVAPIGHLKMVHDEPDFAIANVAASMNIPYIQSTVTARSIEEISEAVPQGPKWFQLYWSNNDAISYSMAERAEKAGYEAIVVTVDTMILGWREDDMRYQYSPLKKGYGKANYVQDPAFQSSLKDGQDEIGSIIENLHHPSLHWDNIAELRKRTKLPIFLKGILHPEDAKQAINAGIDGIIVSNHGGRQMDGVISSLEALSAVRKAVGPDFPLLFDSGVRRGADVIKALALGADAILFGRPYTYALALQGEEGVQKVFANLAQEVAVSMALSGAKTIEEVKQLTLKVADN